MNILNQTKKLLLATFLLASLLFASLTNSYAEDGTWSFGIGGGFWDDISSNISNNSNGVNATLQNEEGLQLSIDYLRYFDNDVIAGGGFAYYLISGNINIRSIRRTFFSTSTTILSQDVGTSILEGFINFGGVLDDGIDLVLQLKLQSSELDNTDSGATFSDGYPSSTTLAYALFLNFALDSDDSIRLYYDFGSSDENVNCSNEVSVFCDGPAGGLVVTYNFNYW